MFRPGSLRAATRPQTRLDASGDSGFSLVELIAASFVIVTLAAMVTIPIRNMRDYYRLSGDARALSNSVAVAKLRAASLFTQTRVYAVLGSGTYQIQIWQKTGTPGWVTEGSITTLSGGVAFGFGAVATPPPTTQATIGQATACHDDLGAAIPGTACIAFNSRGLPVDASGAPTAIGAYYLTDGVSVYASTISATGMIRFWRTPAGATPHWALQ